MDVLVRATVDDLLRAFRVDRTSAVGRMARPVATRIAGRFVDEVLAWDAVADAEGLAVAGHAIAASFARTLRVEGQGRVPADGSLLAVANHPGVIDVPAFWTALAARPDLRVVALDRPFLRALPGITSRLEYAGDRPDQQVALVRRLVAHLRNGRALLILPAGGIEPDPALRPDAALASLATWSRSTALLLRLAPGTALLPMGAGGVISTAALRHPAARGFRDPDQRSTAAAALQVIARRFRDTHTRIVVGHAARPAPRELAPQTAVGLTTRLMRPVLARLAE